jgi:hypothetical protein
MSKFSWKVRIVRTARQQGLLREKLQEISDPKPHHTGPEPAVVDG